MNSIHNEGILLVNKERGKSSFFIVKLLRKLTGIRKIGHAGTLDPFATGVMVMLIGRNYTKLSDSFINHSKVYIASIHLGKKTDTYDCDGVVTGENNLKPSLEAIKAAIESFQGETFQVPPMYSAKKIKGIRLYKLAREGKDVERTPKKVEMQIDIITYSYPILKIQVKSSKGTYIRSLAHDLGEKLGSFAYLDELIRIKCGSYCIEDCIDSEKLKDPLFSITPIKKVDNASL